MQQEQLMLPVGNTVRAPNGKQYVIEELLGRGGFGAVYLVRDRQDEQRVFALKEVIDPSVNDRDRFMHEAELLKRLNHRALPRVYDVFEYEKLKRVYMLMDYVKGRDLEVLLAEQDGQRFSLQLILAVIDPVVDALNYLHNQLPPIVHRDIKPANIIVPMHGEEAVLVDFGLAKEYIQGKTTNVIRHGSPGYAALEHYGHGGTTPRSDIYGLGATLYTLLTGVVPTDPVTRITESRGFDPLEPVSLITPMVSTAVARAIQRAMSIGVEQRFNTVEEFWQELTAHASQPQEQHSHITPARAEKAPLKTPPPLAVTEQQLPPLTSAALEDHRHPADTPFSKRHSRLISAVLALVFMVALAGGIFISLTKHTENGRAAQQTPFGTTNRLITPTPPTPPASPGIYPNMSNSYAGTVGDLLAQHSTPMLLDNVQQQKASLHGFFRGLGQAGPFTGTVTASGHIQFFVIVQGGTSTLAFTGDIKIGGDLVGSYALLAKSGQQLGDSGLWNVAPSI